MKNENEESVSKSPKSCNKTIRFVNQFSRAKRRIRDFKGAI